MVLFLEKQNLNRMKRSSIVIILLIVCLSLISNDSVEKGFHVLIEQDGKILKIKNGKVKLDKSEFNIVIELHEPMGLLINASFNKKTYKSASKGKPKSELLGFQNTGMAEGILNTNKEIFISNKSPSYWYYSDEKNNRFNSVEVIDGKYKCRRTISNLYNIDDRLNINIKDVEKPLYLVFILYKRGKRITNEIEIKREYIKIKWN